MSQPFRFKQFSVNNSASGLKVGTDGVLLGVLAGASVKDPMRILDIGTGTGLVALMLAQRFPSADITGIDIDPDAAMEASENFAASPWAARLTAICCPLQEFNALDPKSPESAVPAKWDIIASNPPFFENSLKAPDAQRSTARHTDTLSYRDIVVFARENMAPGGTLAVILPSSEETAMQRYAASFGLYPQHITYVRTTSTKAPKRIVVQLGFERCVPAREELVMMDGGKYTPAFKELTGEFYL